MSVFQKTEQMSLNAAQCVIKKSYFLSRTTNDDVDGRRFQYRIFLQLIFTGRLHSQFYFPLQKLPNPCLDSPFLYKHNLLSLKQPNFLALFLYFRLFNSEHVHYNFFCRWPDSNRGPLVSEETALPAEPQPLAKKQPRFPGELFFKLQLRQIRAMSNLFCNNKLVP